jgi:hypothetical protein
MLMIGSHAPLVSLSIAAVLLGANPVPSWLPRRHVDENDAHGRSPWVSPLALRGRLRATLCLLSGCVLLALAAAGLPDPLWVSGVYDGGDSDDLLALSADDALFPTAVVVPARESPGSTSPVPEAVGTPVVTVPPPLPRSPPIA